MELTLKDIKDEYRLVGDDSDPWGSAMELWFAVAGELNHRDPYLIPAEWQYRPSPLGGKDPDSYWTELLEDCTDQTLSEMGAILFRYVRYCEFKGLNY